MKKLWIVAKNELIRYFVSPLAYVYLLSFLILNGSFAVYFGDFFNRGQADLYSMFSFQPWIYLLFISGISMRLWAEEFRNKTIVQIMTMPVSVKTLVLGKFFAAWIFCGFALFLTFPFWITVNILGNPDNSVILLGYIASFTLAGCMLAISQTMSALTKNQVIALVLAVIANLAFFWSGIEYILAVFRPILPDAIIDTIASFSFISHFNTLSRGLLELRDIIFFATIIIFFNFTTILIINFKTAGTSGWLKSTNRNYYLTAWIMLLCGFFGINILANNLARNIQFDATEEKIFTLTDNTKSILQKLPEPVLARLYFSNILEQRNPNLRRMFDNIRILMQKYKAVSNGNFDFKTYNPEFLSTEEDIALADGIQPIPLIDLNQNALFGLTFEDTLQNKQSIPFFAQEREGNLEQDITSKIYQLHHKKKVIGVIAGLPIFGSNSDDGNALGQHWKIIDLWEETYVVKNIKTLDDFKQKTDVLVLFYPKNLTKETIAEIKKYSQNGGKILLLLDPANESSRLYSMVNNVLESSDLGELADFWGIKFYNDYVVADLQNSIMVDATANYKTNPTFAQDVIQFKLKPADMNPNHPITKNLNEVMLASASIVMPESSAFENGKIKFYPLLKASSNSQLMKSTVVTDGLNPQEILKYFSPDDNQKFMAAEIVGMEKSNPFDLIAVADTDFVYDTFWATSKNLLESEYIISNFDNANFTLNALDYLTDNFDLIELRGKQAKSRLFEGVEILRKLNSLAFSKEENAIFDKIEQAKKALNEVWNKKDFEERETFTADELAALSGVRSQLNDLRKQLSEIRLKSFASIKNIENLSTIFNIWLIPALIVLILFMLKIIAVYKYKSSGLYFKLDAKLLKLSGICLILLALGFVSVVLSNKSSIDSFAGKLAFPEIAKKINDINKISLKSNAHELTFVQNNGLWQLQEMPDLPVYQERIRRLLTTISQATFFAKKSNNPENLALFNLNPLEDKTSNVMNVKLFNNDDLLQFFELGDIDVDLGRGAKAAYMKFDNQFQVWEIMADFVDMGLDWHKWTYANLLDLRFGRVMVATNIPNQNNLLNFIKYTLNTNIIKVVDLPGVKPIKTTRLSLEDNNFLNMSFYIVNNQAIVAYEFDKNNSNNHLNLLAKYLTTKAVLIDMEQMEKIIDQFDD